MSNFDTCLVIPMYNESNRIDKTYFSSLAKISNVQFLFVDDGSTDNTLALLNEIVALNSNFELLHLSLNVGKGEAIRTGWLQAKRKYDPPFLGFLDGDGAFTVNDVENILNISTLKLDSTYGAEKLSPQSIWSSRVGLSGRNIQRSKIRFLLGRALANTLSTVLRRLPWDTQSGLKIFKSSNDFVDAIQTQFRCKWLFDVEILLRLRAVSEGGHYEVWEEPLETWRDVPNSTVTLKGYYLIFVEAIFLVYQHTIERFSN